jgi:riboflavin synthase
MFTGLVQAVGTVRSITSNAAGVRLLIDPSDLLAASAPAPAFAAGESIAVSGVCLTLVEMPRDGLLAFDAVPETLARTSLRRLAPGSGVNLERSVTAATLMGGHIVQGHVDAVGSVLRVQREPEWRIRVRPGPTPEGDPMEYLPPKGSVTMDGTSLTIAALADADADGWFEVALIPTTLAKTTLGSLREGDPVNLEYDALAKTIVHWLRRFGPGARGRS